MKKKFVFMILILLLGFISTCSKPSLEVELVYYHSYESLLIEPLRIKVNRAEITTDNLPYSDIYKGTNIDFKLVVNGDIKKDKEIGLEFTGINLGKLDPNICYQDVYEKIINIYTKETNTNLEDIIFSHYLGNYNGLYLAVISDINYNREKGVLIIGDIRIDYYTNTDNILAFSNDSIYSLEEAYNDKLLCQNDISFIKYMYRFNCLNKLYNARIGG